MGLSLQLASTRREDVRRSRVELAANLLRCGRHGNEAAKTLRELCGVTIRTAQRIVRRARDMQEQTR